MERSPFIENEIKNYIAKYGDVPPHWIYKPNSHPYHSVLWNQGAGETFVEVFNTWFEKNCKTEQERITYFKKYSPPPRWLAMVIDAIWETEGWNEPSFDYTPYLETLEVLGFEGTSLYETDLNDEKWLEMD